MLVPVRTAVSALPLESEMRDGKAAGLKFYVWTVNDAEVARRMMRIGVDGITIDRPGWLREQLE